MAAIVPASMEILVSLPVRGLANHVYSRSRRNLSRAPSLSMMYHPESLPQPPKIFEHGQKVDVVVEGKKRYLAVFGGLTSDGKHALVRFITGPWRNEQLVFPIEQLEPLKNH